MALKELLVDGEVLDSGEPDPGLTLDDPVNQRGRKPVTEAVEKIWDIEGHGVRGRSSRREIPILGTGEPLKPAQSTRVTTTPSTRAERSSPDGRTGD
jgi:hypothetical protein